MLVKSGIDTTKVYEGLANYGRSFTLSNKNCINYKRPFTNSPKEVGPITETPRFLSMDEINSLSFSNTKFNASSKCFYGIYNNGNNWISWMHKIKIFQYCTSL